MRTDEDFYSIVAIIGIGMAVPVVLSALFHDVFELYLSGRQLAYLAAVVYGFVLWLLLAVYDLDRINVASASVVFPAIGVVILLFVGVSMSGPHDGFRYLFLDFDDLFAYAASYGIAGVGAVALQWKTEALASEYDTVPAPRTIPLGVLVVLALGFLAIGAVGHVTASSAAVASVEPDTTTRGEPVLNVTVESDPTELRLAVTAPDGSTTTHRVTQSDLQDGTATVPIEFWEFDETEPQVGTYTVTLTGLPGLTVDTATHTIESAPSPTLVRTASAPDGDAFDLPPDTVVYGPTNDYGTRVAVVLRNEGDVAARFYVQLLAEDDRIESREIPLEPGQQGAIVFDLSAADVDRIHATADGTASIEIAYGDVRVRTTVELPEP